jgi:hypothetical protein
LTDDGKLPRKKRWAVRARFDRKIADFVVCDRQSLNVIAIVESDDRTHTAHADQQRDAITGTVGYRTIRFQSMRKPTESEIAALFQKPVATEANISPGWICAKPTKSAQETVLRTSEACPSRSS